MKAGDMFASSGPCLVFPAAHPSYDTAYGKNQCLSRFHVDEIAASALDQWRRSDKANMCQLLLRVTGFKTLESLGGTLLALNVVDSI